MMDARIVLEVGDVDDAILDGRGDGAQQLLALLLVPFDHHRHLERVGNLQTRRRCRETADDGIRGRL